MFPFTKIRNFILALAFILFASGLGYELGIRQVRVTRSGNKLVVNQNPPPGTSTDFALFWDVWQRLFRLYVDPAALVPQKMVYGAIGGMVNSLGDPYTIFLPPKENTDFKQDLGGAFEGIGAQLGQKDSHIIIIVAPLKSSPAEKAGLLPGDWIIKVNGEETLGWTVAMAVNKIRGSRGTQVTLTVVHEKATNPIDITITRDTITVPSVTWWEKGVAQISEISGVSNINALVNRPGKVAYLSLSRFGDRTNEEWETAVSELLAAQKKDGQLKGLIFDLRNNPGGYLEGAVFIVSEFVKSGIVVYQVNSDGSRDNYQVNRAGKLLEIPMIVLANKGSASAAEIVAGALRDYNRAKLVGETTFGKGSVQTPADLAGGAGLHITTGKWFTPNGATIDKKGITPDITVPWDNATATNDAQLAKAVELLLK